MTLASAIRAQPIIHVLAAIALFACGKSKPAAQRDAAPAVVVAADAAAPATSADAGDPSNRITISIGKRAPAADALAKRCVLGGDPLTSDCTGGGAGIAIADGTLYLVAGKEVRRYRRAAGSDAAGSDCRWDPAGEPIAMPPDNPRPQKLGGGPMYMRSGGAAWSLATAGKIVYAHDYLGGLFRIDRGKAEPACVDVFGYKTVAQVGKRTLALRNGIEELRLGKVCKAVSAKVDDKARGELYVVRDQLYVASGSELSRYENGAAVKLGEGTRICWVKAVTACGEGACALDSNCMQIIQLGADGKVQRVLDDDKLFATRPYVVTDATTNADGDVYVLARHRDKVGNKEVCEAAVYEIKAAVFAM